MLANVNFGREWSCFRFGFHKGAMYFFTVERLTRSDYAYTRW
jgi:hypothetical protein